MPYGKYIKKLKQKSITELKELRNKKQRELNKEKRKPKNKRDFEREQAIDIQIDSIDIEIVKRKNDDYFEKRDSKLKKFLK